MNYFPRIILAVMLFLNIQAIEAKDYKVQKFHVKSDGVTMNTEALQSLIDKVSIQGGGRLLFSQGTYLTGCIILKSNVEMHFEKGAVLLGSTNPFDYMNAKKDAKETTGTRQDNSELALIVAEKAKNIAITGQGTIDGQGLALALNADSLHHAGIHIDRNYNERRHRPSELVRPKLFFFTGCNDVHIDSMTLKNSACWGLSFDLCSNMMLSNLTVVNRAYWNNDGIDVTDCRNVMITGCNVNAADDGICLKSYHPDSSCDSVYISNCEIRSSASAVKFGTASYGGFKNIDIRNIRVFDTFRSAIAIESVDGGEISNIRVDGIVARNTGNAIFVRLGKRSGIRSGIIRNVSIKNMDVEIPFGRPDESYDLRGPEVNYFHNPFPSSICGIPGNDICGVYLENIHITYPGRATRSMAYLPLSRLGDVPEQITEYPEYSMFGELPSWAFYVRHVQGLTMKNITLRLNADDFRPAFVFDNSKNITLENCTLPENKVSDQYVVFGCNDIHLTPESQVSDFSSRQLPRVNPSQIPQHDQ
jgi:polygalacturonase